MNIFCLIFPHKYVSHHGEVRIRTGVDGRIHLACVRRGCDRHTNMKKAHIKK